MPLTTLRASKTVLNITIPISIRGLTRVINGATDLIERECGKTGMETVPERRPFRPEDVYMNEVYSVAALKQNNLILRNAPVTYLIVTGNLTPILPW